MKRQPSFILLLMIFFLFLLLAHVLQFADAGKRRIHITNDLDDVIDDEEDEAWKEWGKKKTSEPDLPDIDFSQETDFTKIQSEMMKHQTGLAFGFVKLRIDQRRKPVQCAITISLCVCLLCDFLNIW